MAQPKFKPRKKQMRAIFARQSQYEKDIAEFCTLPPDTFLLDLIEAGQILTGPDNPQTKYNDTSHGISLVAIAKELGVTPERARQIEKKAMAKLRHPTIRKQLRGFL